MELGVGDTRIPTGQAVWDTARWDTAGDAWAGTEPTWLDVSCEVNTAVADAGRARIVERFRPGYADVTVTNTDGWADLAVPPQAPATLSVRPGRPIRWGVDTPTGRHVLFRGFIDDAVPIYQPYGTDVVQLGCIDAFGEVGRLRLDELGAPVGAGESADARIRRLLDAVAWPVIYRDIQPTSISLAGTTYGTGLTDLLGQAADSAAGSVFADTAGRIVYRARDWQTYAPDVPPDATIGNVGPGDVCPSVWELSFRRGDVAGRVRLGRTDGSGVVAVAPTPTLIALGPEPFERSDLLTADDADLAVMAERYVTTRGLDTMPRVESVTLDAASDPGDGRVVELMATARPEVPTRIRCRLQARDGRTVFDREMFVTGVAHDIGPTGRWTCTLTLDVAAPFAAAGGRWDTTGWDRSTWADVVAALADARRLLARMEGAPS
jgi:hypothetical protein